MKQHQIVEVSASSAPKDVVGAIVGSTTPKTVHNPIKWFHLAFAFILVFASVIYFREEIYTFSKDVSKHPILASVENQQLHKYLGNKWMFGTGTEADLEELQPELDSNTTAAPAVTTSTASATAPGTTSAKPTTDKPAAASASAGKAAGTPNPAPATTSTNTTTSQVKVTGPGAAPANKTKTS